MSIGYWAIPLNMPTPTPAPDDQCSIHENDCSIHRRPVQHPWRISGPSSTAMDIKHWGTYGDNERIMDHPCKVVYGPYDPWTTCRPCIMNRPGSYIDHQSPISHGSSSEDPRARTTIPRSSLQKFKCPAWNNRKLEWLNPHIWISTIIEIIARPDFFGWTSLNTVINHFAWPHLFGGGNRSSHHNYVLSPFQGGLDFAL